MIERHGADNSHTCIPHVFQNHYFFLPIYEETLKQIHAVYGFLSLLIRSPTIKNLT